MAIKHVLIRSTVCAWSGHQFQKVKDYMDYRDHKEGYYASNGLNFEQVEWQKQRCARCGRVRHIIKEELK